MLSGLVSLLSRCYEENFRKTSLVFHALHEKVEGEKNIFLLPPPRLWMKKQLKVLLRIEGRNIGAENFRLVFHHSHACIYVFSLCFRPFIKTLRNSVRVFAPRTAFCCCLSLVLHLRNFFLPAFSNFQIVNRIFADEFHGVFASTPNYGEHMRNSFRI